MITNGGLLPNSRSSVHNFASRFLALTIPCDTSGFDRFEQPILHKRTKKKKEKRIKIFI